MRKMLLVFAHPDDESFTCGGSIAKYVKAGWQVDLVCATRGEEGNSGPYDIKDKKKIGDIRQKELEEAGSLLGITSISFLGYFDGTLPKKEPGDIEEAVFKAMATYLPDVVITFEPNGISNHPDHCKLTLSTTFAFQKYAVERPELIVKKAQEDPEFIPDTKDVDDPKLYYACMPESVSLYLLRENTLPKESFGKPWVGVPDKFVTTVIDIKRFANAKRSALLAHKTQEKDVNSFLSLKHQPLMNLEFFVLRMQGKLEVFMGKNDSVSNKL